MEYRSKSSWRKKSTLLFYKYIFGENLYVKQYRFTSVILEIAKLIWLY
jgi:hypothetical protein